MNTAHFLLYNCFFKVTKVLLFLINPLFHHVSSEIFLPWVLAKNEGGADVLIQVLQCKKEQEWKGWIHLIQVQNCQVEYAFTKKKKSYVLEVTCGWAVHFALLCCNYILLSAGKVSQLSASREQKSSCCHFSFWPRCRCQLNFLLGSWFFFFFLFHLVPCIIQRQTPLTSFLIFCTEWESVVCVLNFRCVSRDMSKSKWGILLFISALIHRFYGTLQAHNGSR